MQKLFTFLFISIFLYFLHQLYICNRKKPIRYKAKAEKNMKRKNKRNWMRRENQFQYRDIFSLSLCYNPLLFNCKSLLLTSLFCFFICQLFFISFIVPWAKIFQNIIFVFFCSLFFLNKFLVGFSEFCNENDDF